MIVGERASGTAPSPPPRRRDPQRRARLSALGGYAMIAPTPSRSATTSQPSLGDRVEPSIARTRSTAIIDHLIPATMKSRANHAKSRKIETTESADRTYAVGKPAPPRFQNCARRAKPPPQTRSSGSYKAARRIRASASAVLRTPSTTVPPPRCARRAPPPPSGFRRTVPAPRIAPSSTAEPDRRTLAALGRRPAHGRIAPVVEAFEAPPARPARAAERPRRWLSTRSSGRRRPRGRRAPTRGSMSARCRACRRAPRALPITPTRLAHTAANRLHRQARAQALERLTAS